METDKHLTTLSRSTRKRQPLTRRRAATARLSGEPRLNACRKSVTFPGRVRLFVPGVFDSSESGRSHSAEPRNINFGLLLTGTGTAWFDALRIEPDGAPYVNPRAFDLDLESSTAKGFYTGGNGYSVGIDNTTAQPES